MKRLLVLTTLAMFAASATGCGWWRPWYNRGVPCDPCGSTAAYSPGSGYEMAYPPAVSNTPHLLPGPVTTLPGPG